MRFPGESDLRAPRPRQKSTPNVYPNLIEMTRLFERVANSNFRAFEKIALGRKV